MHLFPKYGCANCGGAFLGANELDQQFNAAVTNETAGITRDGRRTYVSMPQEPSNQTHVPMQTLHACSENEIGIAELIAFERK